MRLGVAYNVFDGIELWEKSIDQISSSVDFIVAVVQTTSNFGQKDESCLEKANELQEKGKIDAIHVYEPNLDNTATASETEKRNIGIDICRANDCTNYLLMDVDECYDAIQFRIAKYLIEELEYDSTACGMYTYFKNPEWRITPKENYFVPFIQKLKQDSIVGDYSYSVIADKTRIPEKYSNFYLFKDNELMMHHFSHVRNDYRKKLENSSAKGNWKNKIEERVKMYYDFEIGKEIPFFEKSGIEIVENKFGI